MTDFERYIVRRFPMGGFEVNFPNGAMVSVVPDPSRLLKWEALGVNELARDAIRVAGGGGDGLMVGLGSSDVQYLLHLVAAVEG